MAHVHGYLRPRANVHQVFVARRDFLKYLNHSIITLFHFARTIFLKVVVGVFLAIRTELISLIQGRLRF